MTEMIRAYGHDALVEFWATKRLRLFCVEDGVDMANLVSTDPAVTLGSTEAYDDYRQFVMRNADNLYKLGYPNVPLGQRAFVREMEHCERVFELRRGSIGPVDSRRRGWVGAALKEVPDTVERMVTVPRRLLEELYDPTDRRSALMDELEEYL